MKLSQISTDHGFDVLCELAVYVSNITADEELMSEIKRAINIKDVKSQAEMIAVGIDKVKKFIPIIFKKHRQDVFEILAVLNDKTAEEISKQKLIITAIQIREVIKDKELIDFFKSCTDMGESE